VGLTILPCKKENCWEASKKFSRILWRRPRPKLGYAAKERKKERKERVLIFTQLVKKSLAFYGNTRFITVFTTAHNRSPR
jgi:hypothetical protein